MESNRLVQLMPFILSILSVIIMGYFIVTYHFVNYKWYRRWRGGMWYCIGFTCGTWSRTPPPYDTMLLAKEEYPE